MTNPNNAFNLAVDQMVNLGRKFLIERISKNSKLNQLTDYKKQRELETLYYNEIAATANVIRLFTGREISFQWQNGANGDFGGGFALYEIAKDVPCDELLAGCSRTVYSRYSGKQEADRRINWSDGIKQGKIIKIYELIYDVNANPRYVGGYIA